MNTVLYSLFFIRNKYKLSNTEYPLKLLMTKRPKEYIRQMEKKPQLFLNTPVPHETVTSLHQFLTQNG